MHPLFFSETYFEPKRNYDYKDSKENGNARKLPMKEQFRLCLEISEPLGLDLDQYPKKKRILIVNPPRNIEMREIVFSRDMNINTPTINPRIPENTH